MTEKSVAIGVFLCDCGQSLANIDFARLKESAAQIPDVVHVGLTSSLCTPEGQQEVLGAIGQQGVNRVVVAGCSPDAKAGPLRMLMEQSGLNENFVSVANIREQCAWVHQDDVTDKAIDLVRMAAGRSRSLQPIEVKAVPVEAEVLIVGGGFAGMKTALEVSGLGFKATLLEGATAPEDFRQASPAELEKFNTAKEGGVIEVIPAAELVALDGKAGSFKVRIRSGDQVSARTVGAVALANGFMTKTPQASQKIVSPQRLEEMLAAPATIGKKPEAVGFVLDTTDENSRFSIRKALTGALAIKEALGSEIYVLCKSVKVDSEGMESLYAEARDKGVVFLKFDEKPKVTADNGRVKVTAHDVLVGDDVALFCDLLVAEPEVLPSPNTPALKATTEIRLDAKGFFQDKNVFLTPVTSDRKGIFTVSRGETDPVRGANDISSAAMSFVRLFSPVKGLVEVKPAKCRACLSCIRVCPHDAVELVKVETGEEVARINDLACGYCGICAAICPANAIRFEAFSDDQIMAEVEAMEKDRVAAFCCEKSAYRAADKAGRARLTYPDNVRIIKVPCAGRVDVRHLLRAFEKGVKGALVMGCQEGACQHLTGNARARERVSNVAAMLKEAGISPERVRMVNLAPDQSMRFVREVQQMAGKVEVLK